MQLNGSANASRWATVLSSYLAPAMLVASMTVAQDVGIIWVCTETGCRPTSNLYDAFTPNQIVEGFGCGG
jgi:hypothetical protein